MEKEYRQVVADMSITSSKLFNDYLYGWLVLKADMEAGVRYIWKRDLVYSKIEEELGITRKTLAKYFGYMVDNGLLIDNGDRWELKELDQGGFWVETDKLRLLVELRKRYAISVYVYLIKGYWMFNQRGKKSVPVLLDNVKRYIGLATNTRSNNSVITDLFTELSALGLLKCELVYSQDKRRHFYLLSGVDRTNYF